MTDAIGPAPAPSEVVRGEQRPPARSAAISVMIFTLDEAIHLPACLAALSWCDDIIVIDSYSTDATERICAEHGARFFQHRFEGFGLQRNWALDNSAPRHEWIFVLDADERFTPELAAEAAAVVLSAPAGTGAFRVRRRFYMWGRWLRYSSLYPNWVVRLVHRERVRYENRGHAETQTVDGEIHELENDLIDENLKGIDEWFTRQARYAGKEAEHELAGEQRFMPGELFAPDPLRRRNAVKRLAARVPGRAMLYFLYAYVWRRGFLDGRDGLMFCMMKALYQSMIVIRKHDLRRSRRSVAGSHASSDGGPAGHGT